MMYIRSSSIHALQKEYVSYSELQMEHITATIDDNFKSYSRVAALLSVSQMPRLFFFSANAEELFPDMCTTISEQLQTYREGFSAIDSIYLFPAYSNRIYLSHQFERSKSISQLEDESCLSPADTPDEITFVPRKKNGIYPYLITAYMPVYNKAEKAMIVLNIDVSKIPLFERQTESLQKIYIVSEDGEIWYRSDQEDMPEALDTVSQLKYFDHTKESHSVYVSEGEQSYVYVQQHSKAYDWYYVTVTVPQNFAEKSYDFMSPLLTLIPWLLVAALLIIAWMTRLFSHPIHTIIDFMDNPMAGVPEKITEKESKKVIEQLVKYIQRNEEMSKELDKQLARKNKATYYALQSQINPHFLFNTLNLIRSMEIETLGFDHAAPEMTLTLSKLLQYAFRTSDMVTLSMEFHYLELYAGILEYRYKGMVSVKLQLDEACQDVMVPKMFLQPLVENAVYHGCASNLVEKKCVLVKTERKKDQCMITIQDNGIGMKMEKLEQLRREVADVENIPEGSVGLKNVALRMHIIYGKEFQLQIESEEEVGTTILLSFPCQTQGCVQMQEEDNYEIMEGSEHKTRRFARNDDRKRGGEMR